MVDRPPPDSPGGGAEVGAAPTWHWLYEELEVRFKAVSVHGDGEATLSASELASI